jgi:DNA (cytosine-5)-methyltransferase 1
MSDDTATTDKHYTTVGVFAGIGGIELGMAQAGHHPTLLCERDPAAQQVLAKHFPDVPLVGNIKQLRTLGTPGIVCAGFPCQDLSQAGKTAGIRGAKSRLINEVFRLLDSSSSPDWLLLENVPFMLHLKSGAAIAHIISELEKRAFRWAYRVIDTRAFGLPQRRRRVLLLASKTLDPRPALLHEDVGEQVLRVNGKAHGFYWTEGNTGLGWAHDAVPTLKGGSGLGIPSPPAVWIKGKGLFLPDIRDAERLQGFDVDWTLPASTGEGRTGARWKLVGNAVSVPVAAWLGKRLTALDTYDARNDARITHAMRWPNAAWGERGQLFASPRSSWPVKVDQPSLLSFLRYPLKPLSSTATRGFLSRARASHLRFEKGFLEGVARHLQAQPTGRKRKHRMVEIRHVEARPTKTVVRSSK